LLSLLADAQPRGLPNSRILRIELQRAADGHPLDDVIVHAESPHGLPVTLAIQVKRTLTFTPSDTQYKQVVAQIAQTVQRPDFWKSGYQLAVAIARSTTKVDGAYQDVLSWAREVGSASAFFTRLERKGAANKDMRAFVATFRLQLAATGAPHDDETVWKLLARLQILTFDFTAVGSATEALVLERVVRLLHAEDVAKAPPLWDGLIKLALQIASAGGERTRDRLLQDPEVSTFRLAGQQSFVRARETQAEASRHALADIDTRIVSTTLMRQPRVDAIRDALDDGRYVEIRGASGVGKSGVMKLLAERLGRESQIIVLRPTRIIPRGWSALRATVGDTVAGTEAKRIIPRGWSALRATLGFDGRARDLLMDMAADGGAFLFIDGLEGFAEEQRLTVKDLVDEASQIPGFAVIATARLEYGSEDPSWLSSESIARLKPAQPVVIPELSDDEVEELSDAAPELRALLAQDHPAKDIARNLYRLSRLLSQPSGDGPQPRTEIDMMDQWWRSADGRKDAGHLERARLLKALAEQTLDRKPVLSTQGHPAVAVNALIRSESLRELTPDQVVFRHDVLSEWAAASLLIDSPRSVNRLDLKRAAPVYLARSVELAARHSLERDQNTTRWNACLASVSLPGSHGSWRRAVLLATVRTENPRVSFGKLSPELLANEGALLCELIRTVMAVEIAPGAEVLQSLGVTVTGLPPDHKSPNIRVWGPLLIWILAIGNDLPSRAVPDVAEIIFKWCTGLLAIDPLAPQLLEQAYNWLQQLEAQSKSWSARSKGTLTSAFEDHEVRELEQTLRMTFFLFARRVPDLATAYLDSLNGSDSKDRIVVNILNQPGSLAQAAPKALADLTARTLLSQDESESQSANGRDRPFGWIDYKFIPASPKHGPFYDLLKVAPELGLDLIRRIVDHALSYYTRGRPHGQDMLRIPLPDGYRDFPWRRSYNWSREVSNVSGCVTSALMALEAWAHERMQNGDTPEQVIGDVLGTTDPVPAAYLLVAVDIILSHWPRTREVAVPFLACPELLCLDRERMVGDQLPSTDIFGLRSRQPELIGPISTASLQKMPSRRVQLDWILGQYAMDDGSLRLSLQTLLEEATARLGTPGTQDNFGQPAFMAVHALNLINPANWRIASKENESGQTQYEYVSPEKETKHLQALQEVSIAAETDAGFDTGLEMALDNPQRSSPALASQALDWALQKQREPMPSDVDETRHRQRAILAAAALVARDGAEHLKMPQQKWMRQTFRAALDLQRDEAASLRGGLSFNVLSIAFYGWAHTLKNAPDPISDVRFLLDIAALGDPAGVQGFSESVRLLDEMDPRIPRALVRIGLAASVRPVRDWENPEQNTLMDAQHQASLVRAIDVEMAWLTHQAEEPQLSEFPIEAPQRRRGIRIGAPTTSDVDIDLPRPRRAHYIDARRASLWLRAASRLGIERGVWLTDALRKYWEWTFVANGSRLQQDDEVNHAPDEWNQTFFELVSMYSVNTDLFDRATTDICTLPDEAFFDVLSMYLRALDTVYFGTSSMSPTDASRARSAFAERMMTSRGWSRLRGDASGSVEIHIGPAIASLFFNDYSAFGGVPPKCYLLPPGIDKIDLFMPILARMAASSPCPLVAVAMLNLLEVSPRSSQLKYIVGTVSAWLAVFPNTTTFWIGNGIGRRICASLQQVIQSVASEQGFDSEPIVQLSAILADLVRLGVTEALALETLLSNRGKIAGSRD
jgi:hypothetical protein